MSRRAISVAAAGVVLALSLGACASQSSDATRAAKLALRPPTTTTAPATTSTAPVECTDSKASYPPMATLPAPGTIPADSPLYAIYQRGHLIAGIDENTPHLGERDPRTAVIDGLEVQLVREIARALFGNPDAVVFKTVVTKEKNQVVADGKVDLTASADSMTCERWQLVDFSAEYLTAQHVLLVRAGAGINSPADLAGRAVCVTAGSSSLKLLKEQIPTARPVEVVARNDCLVAIQQGDADAYLGHSTFVAGMHEQDLENTTVLGESLHEQNYGIAMSKEDPELVAFVNAVLQEMRDDGRLAALYAKYLGPGYVIPSPDYSRSR